MPELSKKTEAAVVRLADSVAVDLGRLYERANPPGYSERAMEIGASMSASFAERLRNFVREELRDLQGHLMITRELVPTPYKPLDARTEPLWGRGENEK